eukprot:TRINITY_DN1893_c0_g4_i1.p1 TRINITY_DN1893_c0_g4~~TRINITY_DN1893_c0_g4_i1.p1  ORF type:complete len:349 (+),score=73.86 TRINITY_DN1893_c0_g4_i1:89-1048(+)
MPPSDRQAGRARAGGRSQSPLPAGLRRVMKHDAAAGKKDAARIGGKKDAGRSRSLPQKVQTPRPRGKEKERMKESPASKANSPGGTLSPRLRSFSTASPAAASQHKEQPASAAQKRFDDRMFKRSVSVPQTVSSNMLLQSTLGHRPSPSAAFGRSDTVKRGTYVERWGPLGARQKHHQDAVPLHNRPEVTHPLSKGRSKSSGAQSGSYSTPRKSTERRVSGQTPRMAPALRALGTALYEQMAEMLLTAEAGERAAIEWGAANALKLAAASFNTGVGRGRRCRHPGGGHGMGFGSPFASPDVHARRAYDGPLGSGQDGML